MKNPEHNVYHLWGSPLLSLYSGVDRRESSV